MLQPEKLDWSRKCVGSRLKDYDASGEHVGEEADVSPHFLP